MKRTNCLKSIMICTKCGTVNQTVPRSQGRQRADGHIKDICCIKCGTREHMIEIKENGKGYQLPDGRWIY